MASDPTKPRVNTKRGVPPPAKLPTITTGIPMAEIDEEPTQAVDTVVLDLDLSVGIGPAPWEKKPRRYLLVKYAAVATTGKCMECGERDYEYLLVDSKYIARLAEGRTDQVTLACWCSICLARLGVEMLEAVGI